MLVLGLRLCLEFGLFRVFSQDKMSFKFGRWKQCWKCKLGNHSLLGTRSSHLYGQDGRWKKYCCFNTVCILSKSSYQLWNKMNHACQSKSTHSVGQGPPGHGPVKWFSRRFCRGKQIKCMNSLNWSLRLCDFAQNTMGMGNNLSWAFCVSLAI